MATLNDWASDIGRDIPQPLESIVERHTAFVLQDFFRRSEAWRHSEVITLTLGARTYPLGELPSDTYARSASNVRLQGPQDHEKHLVATLLQRIDANPKGKANHYALERDEITIDSIEETGELLVEVIVQPTRFCQEIDEVIADRYFDDIRTGVIARLLLMPGKDWTDVGSASNHGQLYEQAILQAKREARNDRNRPKRSIRFNRDFGW